MHAISCGSGSALIWILYAKFGPTMSKLNSRWLLWPICFVLSQHDRAETSHSFPFPDCSWIPCVRAPRRCQQPPLDPSDDSTFNKAICLFSTRLLHIAHTIQLPHKLLFLKLLAFIPWHPERNSLPCILLSSETLNTGSRMHVNLLEQTLVQWIFHL